MKQQNKKLELGNCGKCGVEIRNNNLGYDLEDKGGFICDECYKKHLQVLIKNIQDFIKSREFDDKLEAQRKVLWISEQMGNWHDNADKSSMESVTDYDSWSLRKLKLEVISELEALMQEAKMNLKEVKKLHQQIAQEHDGEEL